MGGVCGLLLPRDDAAVVPLLLAAAMLACADDAASSDGRGAYPMELVACPRADGTTPLSAGDPLVGVLAWLEGSALPPSLTAGCAMPSGDGPVESVGSAAGAG